MAPIENKITRHPVSSFCALCVSRQALKLLFFLTGLEEMKCSFPHKQFFYQIAVISNSRDVAEGRLMLLDK